MTAELIDATSNAPLAMIWQRTLDPVQRRRRPRLAGDDRRSHALGGARTPSGAARARRRNGRGGALRHVGASARATTRGGAGHAPERAPPLDRHAPRRSRRRLRSIAADDAEPRPARSRRLRFERVYSAFPSTTGSHMSMLTSLLPCAHGVTVPNGKPAPAIPTLAELLAGRGYATVGITEDGSSRGVAGFNRGLRPLSRSPAGSAAEPGRFPRRHRPRAALARRRGSPDEPFFMFLHTYQVHILVQDPAAPDGPLHRARRRGRVAAPHGGLRHRACATRTSSLAGFLDFLQARGLLAKIVLVVTSDHGTEFGERGGIGHAKGVHTEQLPRPAPGALSRRGFASARDRRRGRRRPACRRSPRAGRL